MSTAELETSLKSTLHSLSLILAFYSSIQALQVTAYAQHPPRQQAQNIRTQTENFEKACREIEQRILRAIAVLERDARKAAGQPPLIPTPPPAILSPPKPEEPAPAPPTTSDAIAPSSAVETLDLTVVDDSTSSAPPAPPAPPEDPLAALGIDTSLLDSSLFGGEADSAANGSILSNVDLSTLLPPASAAPTDGAAGGGAGGEEDFTSLLSSLVGGMDQPMADPNAFLASLGGGSNGGGSTNGGLGDLSGLGGGGSMMEMDFSGMDFSGSGGGDGQVDLDELLKSLGGPPQV
ncbi:hypothetical protein MNV49_002149 [Pseudohyphozyma bogoriensis]|nr:hypothetical protein MNV49_002149 [Pseudohyphozyma bogoriensis]